MTTDISATRSHKPGTNGRHPDMIKAYQWMLNGGGKRPIVGTEHQVQADNLIRRLIENKSSNARTQSVEGEHFLAGESFEHVAAMMERLGSQHHFVDSVRCKAAEEYSAAAQNYLAGRAFLVDPEPAVAAMKRAIDLLNQTTKPSSTLLR